MPFRPRIPLRRLLPRLQRHTPHPPVPQSRPLSYSPSSVALSATATESEEEAVVGRDAPLAPPRPGASGGVPPERGWAREGDFGENEVEHERKASIATQLRRCHELLWQRKWQEMRSPDSASTLCDILSNGFRDWHSSSILWDALANSYVRSQMIDDALYVLSKMSSLRMQISVSTYDSLMYSLRKTGMALEIFEKMESSGLSPSDYSHSILIDGLCKEDKISEALSFLQKVRKEGKFKALEMTFNTLMSALCKLGFIQDSNSIFCLMLKYGLTPNKYTYSTIIHGLCKVGSVREAFDIFERVTEEGMELDTVTYNSLINGFRLHGHIREIPKMIDMMKNQGIEPDLVTYTILIAGHCEGGDVKEGMKIRKDIIDQGLELNIVTYSILINALFKKGLFYDVENLLVEICSIGLDLDVVAYSILIHGYCKLGEIGRALQVCNVMCSSQRVMPTSLNHVSILLGLCKKGFLDVARLYLENVATKYQPTDVVLYNVVIDGYTKVGDIDTAVQVYDQIVMAGMSPTIVTCNSLLYGYCKIGDLHKAESYFRAIQISDLQPTTVTYTTLMDALSEAGKVHAMLSVFKEMTGKGIKANAITYSVVLKGLCKQLMFHDARNVLDDMYRQGYNADPIPYNTIIQGFCEARDVKMAFHMYELMVHREVTPTPVTYNLLINVLCLKGLVIHAEMELESFRKQGAELRKFAYTTLIKVQCAKGMPHRAIMWFGKLLDAGFDVSIEDFSAAINRLCKRQFTKEALLLIPVMLSVGVYPDIQLYNVLGTAIRKRDELFYLPILQALAIKTVNRVLCFKKKYSVLFLINSLMRQDVKCVSSFKPVSAHSAGILAESQVDLGESVKQEDHVLHRQDCEAIDMQRIACTGVEVEWRWRTRPSYRVLVRALDLIVRKVVRQISLSFVADVGPCEVAVTQVPEEYDVGGGACGDDMAGDFADDMGGGFADDMVGDIAEDLRGGGCTDYEREGSLDERRGGSDGIGGAEDLIQQALPTDVHVAPALTIPDIGSPLNRGNIPVTGDDETYETARALDSDDDRVMPPVSPRTAQIMRQFIRDLNVNFNLCCLQPGRHYLWRLHA
ncbi:hypothetical protein HU200_022252 [Digitaria exilis]|uniref:Pentatricopeptide repeat-containing protein n=1 Tax=Digitaria exilis TaxID=1010633 RepID=A0A835EYP7_9POAL|nr:hypothetical protein HU200_022252 [Digitaria exilis]